MSDPVRAGAPDPPMGLLKWVGILLVLAVALAVVGAMVAVVVRM